MQKATTMALFHHLPYAVREERAELFLRCSSENGVRYSYQTIFLCDTDRYNHWSSMLPKELMEHTTIMVPLRGKMKEPFPANASLLVDPLLTNILLNGLKSKALREHVRLFFAK